MEAQAYLHTDTYHSLIDRLESVTRSYDPAAPADLRSTLIEALGDVAGLWPVSAFNGESSGRLFIFG